MANLTNVVMDYDASYRYYRKRYVPMEIDDLSDEAIQSVYRFNRSQISFIEKKLEPIIDNSYQNETLRGRRLTTEQHLVIALKFYGHGSSFRNLGEQYGVGIGTVSRVINSVTNAIPLAFSDSIKVPTTREGCQEIATNFYAVAGIPNIIGCVDGTLIPIQRPTINEHVYVSRKGYHSINAMAVCRDDLRFVYVDASFPGATQDAAVFRESKLREAFCNGIIPQGYLIGDSGYALSTHLLTPVPHPNNLPETNYNKAHRRTRNCIERALGVLKSRFRCIDKSGGPLRLSPPKCASVINAVAILHNLAIEMALPLPDLTNDLNEDDPFDYPNAEHVENPNALHLRRNVISLFD